MYQTVHTPFSWFDWHVSDRNPPQGFVNEATDVLWEITHLFLLIFCDLIGFQDEDDDPTSTKTNPNKEGAELNTTEKDKLETAERKHNSALTGELDLC